MCWIHEPLGKNSKNIQKFCRHLFGVFFLIRFPIGFRLFIFSSTEIMTFSWRFRFISYSVIYVLWIKEFMPTNVVFLFMKYCNANCCVSFFTLILRFGVWLRHQGLFVQSLQCRWDDLKNFLVRQCIDIVYIFI